MKGFESCRVRADGEFQFDLALSLLDEDERLAHQVRELVEPASVFLYSERQLELVGNDGIEEFTALFGRDARTVAILLRRGWGETKWTRVEESAIRERFWRQGPDFLTVFRLDCEPMPFWVSRHGGLPHRLRADRRQRSLSSLTRVDGRRR